MKRSFIIGCVLVAAIGAVLLVWPNGGASQPPPDDSQTPEAPTTPPETPPDPSDRPLVLPGITLDWHARTVTVQAEVVRRKGLLELVLCSLETKEHESLMHTEARPSDIHAALLALGLAPGVAARWIQFEDEPGRAIPPRGAALTVNLSWIGDDGIVQTVEAGQWLQQAEGAASAVPNEWIFVGSDLLPDGAYWADGTGDIICVSNFPSGVIDVPFESTNLSDVGLLFLANTDAIPAVGTPVAVIIAPKEGAETADYARAMVHVDPLGRVEADGQALTIDQLEAWASDYVGRHAKGQVVIRSDPRTMGHYVDLVRIELRMGGVFDVIETRALAQTRLLPRTPHQAEMALARFREDLAEGDVWLFDPRGEMADTLERIELQTQELERVKALWAEYAMHLRQLLNDAPPAEPAPDEPQP
ncbi:MAG: YdjY domain-containing protein [Planctomycetota bacterium]|jgi:hypothetical protein